jgi:hypothetical protein
MQSLFLSRARPSAERSLPATFNVVLMYEDFETRERAKKSLDYLEEEFGNDFEFRHGFDFFEQAVSDAEDQAEPSLKLVWAF